MAHYRKLVGKKCYLSPCSLDDAEQWAAWLNDLEVMIPLGDEAYTPYALEKVREELGEIIQHQSHVFDIVELEGDRPIGRGLLFNVDPVNRAAMLGLFIGDKSRWGQGFGQEATQLLLDYGFNLLNLNSIMLGVYTYNTRAIRCYQKAGFKEIGRRRQARIVAGKAYDVILMDILAEEFGAGSVARVIEP